MPITVILLIVVLVLSCLIGRKVCRRVSNSTQIKGDNNIVDNKIHNTYFITSSKDNYEQQADTTPLSKREWLLLTSLADGYERAAGFRAAGAIYHTAGAWPRYFICKLARACIRRQKSITTRTGQCSTFCWSKIHPTASRIKFEWVEMMQSSRIC